ncbi:hypothetical protein IVB22_24330 [Bradyrhizobium sp. 190]|uniref:hypothetical protein n=1 Tax=Bradyrhizobium sp. 190 TaxID=2782658 RepID=UPI001FFB0EAB|nr:hypothetical protein [Bradyrhizobium sp. 190]MCK1515624.1 hypothetical protein [Bradyrhizobium sp. 190]
MTNGPPQSVEPFVHRVSLPDGRYFRVGYRAEGLGYILAGVEVPVHVLEREVAAGLDFVTAVSPSGEVVSRIVDSSGFDLVSPCSVASIDSLIVETVSTNNLHLEEASTSELRGLLRSLELSIEHVKTALAQTCAES